MTLLGLGIASKLPLLSKKTLLPFGRDVILSKSTGCFLHAFASDAANLLKTNTNLA